MAENLSLGKKGKLGEIDFSKIRSGIKKKDLIEGVDSKLKSVFEQIINKIDTNPDDNMLSREELQAFWQELEKLSEKDGNLSSKEARKYQLNGENIGRKGNDALFAVLNKLTELSKEVKNIKTETIDGQEVEVIEYNNNKTEKIFPDGSKIVIITNGKSVKSTTYDKNDNKKEECVEDDNTKDTTIYDGEKKIKVVVLNKNDQTKTTVYYDNSEIPIKRELEKGNVKEEFEKVDVNGKKEWQKSKKIERINDFDQTTSYKYDAQGSLSSENVVTSKGTIERSYNADGSVTSIISNKNEPVHTLNYQKDNESDYTDSYQAGGANITDSYQDNKHIRQVKEINGTSYEVNYDENGNTVGIVVQNGESIQQIANKFGVSVKDLVKVNATKIHGKYPNAYFSVGDEIKIPKKLEADAEVLQGRKSREEAISEYRQEAEIRRQKAEEARAAKEMELQSREKIKWTEKKYNTFYEVAEQLFKNEGTPNPTKEQIQERAEELKKDNQKLEDGDLKGKVIYAMVSKETFERVTERAERKEIARNQQKSKEAEALAKDFYQIADKYESGDSIYRMQKFINENINKNNILDFITAYNKGNIKQDDNSIIDTITSEKLTPGGQKYQKALLKNLMNILCEAAQDAGVPKTNIEKARNEFDESVDKEYKAFYRLTNPIDMEAAMNYLCGEILAAKNKLPSNDSDNAIEEFKENFETTHIEARRSFDTAREEEGVFAKAGDWVCGLFGCNTIEDLENKLKIDKENLDKLLNAKSEAEFKVAYKKIFGIDFDKNKILAYQNSENQYNGAVLCNELIKQYDKILKMGNGLSLDDLKKELKFDKDTISKIVGNESNEENIKNILLKYIQSLKKQLPKEYQKITKGKSLEQLQYEMDMLNQSAYGTNDIAKEVAQFNKNMIVTEMVTLGTAEIAGTILLQFVPGAGQLAAARLAAKTVSWGAKFAKVTKALNTIEKGFAVAKKFQTGQYFASNMANRAGQIGFNMATTGTATAVAGKINENDAKEILHKTLMNMSFAGVGSTSSILAPKLMKAFNISNTLATELAEEIINAAGSYGVVTYTGGEYGQQDAFIDMVTGLIIARLSHIKSNPTAPAQGRGVKTPAPEMPAPKAPAPELDNTRPQAREQSTTPVIDKASSHGEANPSVVNIGAKKADAIKTEVESALNNPEISGEELARIRQEVEALSDRELRRELLEKIDNKAKSLEAPKQEVFNEKKAENLENNVNHIFEKHSELNATDVRVLNEYISGIEDVNVLNELKDKLRQKELTHGGVTANYKNLYKSIDDRVKALTPKPEISNEKVRSYVYSMLNSDKGMVKEEVEQLLDYIKNVSSQEELKEIASLVGKKKMIGTYKKQLQNAINERSNTLKTVNNEPKVEETPEVDEAPRSDNTPKNDGIQDDINASGNYKKDVNGHILPEEYKNMSNDELIEEYTRLKEYELDGRVIRIGELSIKSHDASAQKSAIRQELENRGLKLTRSYDGNKTVYGYDNAEKAPDSNKTHESENANKTPGSDKPNGEKSFETMNPDELFAEYDRLKKEVTYSPLSTADKAANINKMKEIEKLINQKGYKIEGDKIIKNNNEAPKSESSADKSEAPKSNYTAAELRQKLGEKLYKAYQKADDFIAKLRNIDDYKKVKNYIQANFHKYVDIMDHLLDKLEAAAKKIGLKFRKAVDDVNGARNVRRSASSSAPDWINSFGGKNSDIKCQKGERVKADINTRLRLGNKVDIDLSDLQDKLNAMQDGDFFMIGRNVNGINDIRINNEFISGEHLKIEKINGEIYVTDMSRNGTILNTTSPDYAAKWKPDMAGQYNNARNWNFNDKCDQYYGELRLANYSDTESVNTGKITNADIDCDGVEFEFVRTIPGNGWSWRRPKKIRGKDINVVDRISLNVKADRNCLRELDMLLEKGVYINSKGQKVKVDVPDAYYKTPKSLDRWKTRHDPITMYFEGKVSKELEDAIAEITAKYARKPSNGKALMNSLEGKPWIAHEAYTPVEDAKALYSEAKKLNLELADGIAHWVGVYENWNCSTGMFAAAQRMVDEYKLSLRYSANLNGELRILDNVEDVKLTASKTRSKSSSKSRKAAYAKFDPEAKLVTYKDFSGSKILDRNAQYSIIDYDKPPKLTFVDGTSIDLNTPDIKNKIRNLQPGEYITIGREGDILIPNASEQISPHHILIVRTNSGVAIKDVSDVGGTIAHTYEYGFKPQTEGKTTVNNLKPEEVLVTQVNQGYNIYTKNNTIQAFDTRNLKPKPNGYVIYNSDYNVTAITIAAKDHFGRFGTIGIFIKGNISKNDMQNFMKYLKENNIITQDNIDGKTFVNGAEIQKEAIKYFSTFN